MSRQMNTVPVELRLKKLEAALVQGPISRKALARKLNVSEFTIRMDTRRLEKLGSDVKYVKDMGWIATNAVYSDNLKFEI